MDAQEGCHDRQDDGDRRDPQSRSPLSAGVFKAVLLFLLVGASERQRGIDELVFVLRDHRGVLGPRPGLPHLRLHGHQPLRCPAALIPELRRHVDAPPHQQRRLLLLHPAAQPVPAGQEGLVGDGQMVFAVGQETGRDEGLRHRNHLRRQRTEGDRAPEQPVRVHDHQRQHQAPDQGTVLRRQILPDGLGFVVQ